MSVADELRTELGALGAGSMRPFDVHAHTGVDLDGTARTAVEHLRDLEAIDGRSVIFPLCVAGGYEAENGRVIEESLRAPDRLVPFARIDPRVDRGAEAAAALAAGARGFKLHPRAEGFDLGHPGLRDVFAVAAEARVPVLIHAGSGVGSFGSRLTSLAAEFRPCPIILAHAGVSDLAWIWRVLADHPNLFFDTAWLVPADLLALFSLVPPGRILYGSDAPLMDVELLLAITLRCARARGLDDDAVALVMGGQLERLLAGEPGLESGPPPGSPRRPPTVEESRLATLLSAVGGCLLSGGDPGRPLELARLAVDRGAPGGERLGALIDAAGSAAPEAVRATIFALTLAITPGVGAEMVPS